MKKTFKTIMNTSMRSLLICLVVFVVSMCFFASFILLRASSEMEEDLLTQIGATLHVGPNIEYQNSIADVKKLDDEKYYPPLSDDLLKEIEAIPGVLGIECLSGNSIVDGMPINFSNSKKNSGEDPFTQTLGPLSTVTQDTLEINQESVNLVGCIHPEYYDYFRRNLSELTEGEFPSTSNRGAIISETLAEENNLHVGDFIEIKPYQTGVEISDDAVKEDIIFGDQIISIKITGIFGTKLYFNVAETNQNGSAIFRISPYNTIFVDYNTAVSITESTPEITFFDIIVDSPSHLDSVMESVSSLDLDWDKYELTNTTMRFYDEYSGQLAELENITSIMIAISVVIGIIVFMFATAAISKDDEHDIGVYVCLGKTRFASCKQVFYKYIAYFLLVIPITILAGYIILSIIQSNISPELQSNSDFIQIVSFEIGENNFVSGLDVSPQAMDMIALIVYEIVLLLLLYVRLLCRAKYGTIKKLLDE